MAWSSCDADFVPNALVEAMLGQQAFRCGDWLDSKADSKNVTGGNAYGICFESAVTAFVLEF
jgi:hypothetical protein